MKKIQKDQAEIDSSQLLPTNKEINIDSKIDGNMEIALGSVSLDKLLLKIAITKIGTWKCGCGGLVKKRSAWNSQNTRA
jgi:hypothetical protein